MACVINPGDVLGFVSFLLFVGVIAWLNLSGKKKPEKKGPW